MIAINAFGAHISSGFVGPSVWNLFNHPDIAPAIGPTEARPYDVSSFVADPYFTVVFHTPYDAGVFIPSTKEPFVWEGHFLYTTLRGRAAVEFSRFACQTLFDATPADAIVGNVPVERKDVRVMAIAIGCRRDGTSVDIQGRSCIRYIMER